ncbi:hypothetical protein [Nostoc sp.]
MKDPSDIARQIVVKNMVERSHLTQYHARRLSVTSTLSVNPAVLGSICA